jgi:hypothetical protein
MADHLNVQRDTWIKYSMGTERHTRAGVVVGLPYTGGPRDVIRIKLDGKQKQRSYVQGSKMWKHATKWGVVREYVRYLERVARASHEG